MMITIIDYGMGNLGSIYNMFKKIKVESKITSDPTEILNADKLLLPGVGSFDRAMQRINNMGIREKLNNKVLKEQVPILGICLGMQLLTKGSEEGRLSGLGWIEAHTLKFRFNNNELKLKVPHMGWNLVKKTKYSPLTDDLPDEPRYYFVHSYYVKVLNESDSILKTFYGLEFDSAVQRENIFGAQFHPEKSHKFGMKILENFAKI